MGMRTFIGYLLIATGSAACSSFQEVELTDITNVEILRMDPRTLALRVDARIQNPNNFTIEVVEPEVDLFLNDKYIGKGVLDSALVLERKRAQVYPVYLHADLEGGPLLMMLLSGALAGEMKLGAKGTIAGRSGPLKKRFPFEVEEMVRLSD